MAKITLKRVINTSGDVAELYPTTTLDQIISEGTGAEGADESLSNYLSSTYVPLSQKAAANGVATLGSDSKIPIAQLPDAVFDSLLFYGTIDASGTPEGTFATSLEVALQDANAADRNIKGYYWVVSVAGEIDEQTTNIESQGGEYFKWTFDNDDAGQTGANSTSTGTVEVGDWIVCTSINDGDGTSGQPYILTFSVISNTYEDATASVKGIVQLSDASDTSALSGNDVITEGVLNSLIGSIGDANKLAPAAHNHDDVYYTETEIGQILDGTTAITGYNKTNWDDAYSGEITGLSYSNGTITLARDSGSEADLTATISGSIDFGAGSVLTANKFTFKNDLDGNNESPLWSLVEYDNQPSVESFDGANTVRSAIVTAANLVTKATAADFEKIFYLASGTANTDTTVGSIIVQED